MKLIIFQTCTYRLLPVGVASNLHSAVSQSQSPHSVSSLLSNNNKSTAELQYYCYCCCWVSTHCTHCTERYYFVTERHFCLSAKHLLDVFVSTWVNVLLWTDSRWVCELCWGENEALPGDLSGDLLRSDRTGYVWFCVCLLSLNVDFRIENCYSALKLILFRFILIRKILNQKYLNKKTTEYTGWETRYDLKTQWLISDHKTLCLKRRPRCDLHFKSSY